MGRFPSGSLKLFMANVPASEDEVRIALEKAETINLMGRRSVSIAIEMGSSPGPAV